MTERESRKNSDIKEINEHYSPKKGVKRDSFKNENKADNLTHRNSNPNNKRNSESNNPHSVVFKIVIKKIIYRREKV